MIDLQIILEAFEQNVLCNPEHHSGHKNKHGNLKTNDLLSPRHRIPQYDTQQQQQPSASSDQLRKSSNI